MPRIHAFEIADLQACPKVLREAAMAFLRHVTVSTGQARQIAPIVERALERSGETKILDLCSGGGGPMLPIAARLARVEGQVDVTLSDVRPDPAARALAAQRSSARVRYAPEPVDARAVPGDAAGLRTLLNAFHHFRPDDATAILASAVEARQPIVVVEVARRSLVSALAILGTPLHVLFLVPRLRPLLPAWIPLTYLLPILPLTIFWDAFVSCLRTYSREELLAMTRQADPHGRFAWRVEEPRITGPIRGIALTGIPRERLG